MRSYEEKIFTHNGTDERTEGKTEGPVEGQNDGQMDRGKTIYYA